MVSLGQPEPDPHKGFLSKVILRIIKARPDQSPFISLNVNEVRDHFLSQFLDYGHRLSACINRSVHQSLV